MTGIVVGKGAWRLETGATVHTVADDRGQVTPRVLGQLVVVHAAEGDLAPGIDVDATLADLAGNVHLQVGAEAGEVLPVGASGAGVGQQLRGGRILLEFLSLGPVNR